MAEKINKAKSWLLKRYIKFINSYQEKKNGKNRDEQYQERKWKITTAFLKNKKLLRGYFKDLKNKFDNIHEELTEGWFEKKQEIWIIQCLLNKLNLLLKNFPQRQLAVQISSLVNSFKSLRKK